MTRREATAGVLAYWRGDDVFVLVRLADEPVKRPSHDGILIASNPPVEAPAGEGDPVSGPGGDAHHA
jgi:hypothetical protein